MWRLTVVLIGLSLAALVGACSDSSAPASTAKESAIGVKVTDDSPQGEKKASLGALEIFSDPTPALVYVDGAFVGQTAETAPLVIRRESGPVDLRLSCPQRGDGIYRVTIPPGEILVLKATLTMDPQRWDRPTGLIPIGPGQELRGALLPGPDGKTEIIRYVEQIDLPVERILGVVMGEPVLRVIDPDGRDIELRPMPEGIESAPGQKFMRLSLTRPGPHIIEVAGQFGGYLLNWQNGLPPLSGSNDPRLGRRRKAPEVFGPPR